jgi:hypothetical protein
VTGLCLLLLAAAAHGAEWALQDKLTVDGAAILGKVNQGASSTERFYPNVISDHQDASVTGAWIIHTPIPRASDTMLKLRVHGYAYGAGDDVDFTVAGYATQYCSGSIDAQTGCVLNYDISDKGTDKWRKYAGIDASGNLAVAFGDADSSADYYRVSVDAWVTMTSTDYSSGWSIDRSQAANFNWKDIHSLEAHNFTGGEAAASNYKYTAGFNDWRNAGSGWTDIPYRSLSYDKRRSNSYLRIRYQDKLGTAGTGYNQCIWQIVVDSTVVGYFSDADIASGAFYGSVFWRMHAGTHTAIGAGFSRGTHAIKVQSYRNGAQECLMGYNTSGGFLSVEEVGP